ncbi:MAG: hypothetical protein IKJ79_05395 [Bacteroidaceae bacterium]|nr:hypothetical protein [Bacteroidaceae bacterium]
MKRFLKILTVILLLGYLVASVLMSVYKSEEVVCQRFYISVCDSAECQLITADKLYKYLGKQHLLPEGKLCCDINLSAIEQSVGRIDLLTNIDCYYEQNGDVYLMVEQRRPFMRVITDDGDTYYLDREGVRIAVDTMYVAQVPLVTGNVDDRVSAASLIPLIEYIEAHEFWCKQVAQIYVSPQHEIMLYPRVGNHVILLGAINGYERKMESVLALYNQALPQVGWNTYDVISVKYKDQVVCSRRDRKYRHKTWTKKTLSTYE